MENSISQAYAQIYAPLATCAVPLYHAHTHMIDREAYFKELAERTKTSHIYRKYQATGVALAELLQDKKHTALYIKLAKQANNEELIRIAKTITEKKDISNYGAYFMKVVHEEGLITSHARKSTRTQ